MLMSPAKGKDSAECPCLSSTVAASLVLLTCKHNLFLGLFLQNLLFFLGHHHSISTATAALRQMTADTGSTATRCPARIHSHSLTADLLVRPVILSWSLYHIPHVEGTPEVIVITKSILSCKIVATPICI